MDENNKYYCINNSSCPDEYPKYIDEKKKCIKNSIDKHKSSNNIYKEYSSLLEMDLSSFATGKNEEFKNLLNTIQNIQNNEKNEAEK